MSLLAANGFSIDWSDTRAAYRSSRELLQQLAADRPMLSKLVRHVASDPELLEDCDRHPVIDRLTLYRDEAAGIYLRLHIARAGDEVLPHDHKYGFTTLILRGSYTHVWRRRLGNPAGEFTSTDIAPGLVTIERPGSCYCLQHTQVHQTIMERDTVTLFLRGPRCQERSYAAMDMLQNGMQRYASRNESRVLGDGAAGAPGDAHRYTSHTELSSTMTLDECAHLVQRLVALGVIQ